MREFLSNYEMNPTTWVYLSSLMIIGIYFKFRRFWSVRNLDLLALIAFSPGLLLVSYSLDPASAGRLRRRTWSGWAMSGCSASAASSWCGCCWIP